MKRISEQIALTLIKLNGEFTYALKRLLCDPLPWHVIYGHYLMSLLPLDQRHHVGEVWARLEQGESRYAPDKYFSYNSFLTFTFDIKNLFNVIKHTLLESSVYVKYGPKILNGQYAFFEKRDVYVVRFDLDPWTTIFFLKSLHTTKPQPYCERSMGQIWPTGK